MKMKGNDNEILFGGKEPHVKEKGPSALKGGNVKSLTWELSPLGGGTDLVRAIRLWEGTATSKKV